MCIQLGIVLAVVVHIVSWVYAGNSVRLTTWPGVGPAVVFGALTGAMFAWIEYACRHVRVMRGLTRFACIPCGLLCVAMVVGPVSLITQPTSRALVHMALVAMTITLLVPISILSVVYALPVMAPVVFSGTRTGHADDLAMSRDWFVAQCECAHCGYHPGNSSQIVVCPECGCDRFVVRDTDESAPQLPDPLPDKETFSPDEVGMSHAEFLRRSRCERCGYAPGASAEIVVCPECGWDTFVVPLEPDDMRAALDSPDLLYSLILSKRRRYNVYFVLTLGAVAQPFVVHIAEVVSRA